MGAATFYESNQALTEAAQKPEEAVKQEEKTEEAPKPAAPKPKAPAAK